MISTAYMFLCVGLGCVSLDDGDPPQYRSGDIVISKARSDEPLRKEFSLEAARDYLANGNRAWTEQRSCVACHTNGTFMQFAPALPAVFGEDEVGRERDFFVKELARLADQPLASLQKGLQPTQLAYLAHGLVSWDAHGNQPLSDETRQALDLMLSAQSEDGSFRNMSCWPPFESSEYQGATVAAIALGMAPEYLAQMGPAQRKAVDRLKQYLQTTEPPHDYARVLLLWAGSQWEGLVDEPEKQQLVEMILSHQKQDGGWSMRTFATPETWGGGVRSDKLHREPEFTTEPSDGHQTGLAIMVLREIGIEAGHPSIQSGIQWLKTNQRVSGRWWTRSLNTDKSHFITYSGTFYPLVALAKCGELPELAPNPVR